MAQSKYKFTSDAVSDDRNWIALIQNEMNCAAQWQQDWGFLAGGKEGMKAENALKVYTIDDKIRLAEEVSG